MKKCPYCGYSNDNSATVCNHCYAGFPAKEQDKKEPVKAQKPKRSEKHGS